MKSLGRVNKFFPDNFSYLLLLTVFFILIEIEFFTLCNQDYLDVITTVKSEMRLPPAAYPAIAFFIVVQLLLHVGYTFGIGWLAMLLQRTAVSTTAPSLSFSITLWLYGIFTILAANAYYYPNSLFSQLFTPFAGSAALGNFMLLLFLSWLGMISWVLYKTIPIKFLLASIFACLMLFLYQRLPSHYSSAANTSHPNIIIVGVDSLRPDITDFFSGEAHTPFMSQFLKQSTVFSEAVTPLARTYPSWVGILTGEYPAQTKVRTNLSSIRKIDSQQTLPALLRQQGYETIYATDETRFSNIDKTFGFDQILSPLMGVNDFLLGTLNDFPLSNLWINTSIGKWLFPYSYANRAAYAVYDPNSFIQNIQSLLLQSHTKPLFLAVHFCLPHYPFLYNRMVGDQFTGQERYVQSVQRVDQQIQDFFSLLQQGGLLNHAVVVMLSDHGEALELPGDRITEQEAYLPAHKPAPNFYPPSKEHPLAMDQSAGHGTDVLGLSQYHSLLAFRLYGLAKQEVRVVPGVVSLLDIKPTLLDVARTRFLCTGNACPITRVVTANTRVIPTQVEIQGSISLAPYILYSQRNPPNRMIFLESDYSPDAIRSVYPNVSQAILEGVNLLQINPKTMRLSIKPDALEMIMKSKQYAVMDNHWMLATYPQPDDSKISILINLRTGNWTSDMHSAFADTSPVRAMQQALQRYM